MKIDGWYALAVWAVEVAGAFIFMRFVLRPFIDWISKDDKEVE